MSIEAQMVLCVSAYKIISLLTGLAFSYMGYQLFVKKITGNAGSVDGSGAGYKLRIMNAAPGTFFAVFGAIIVAYTIGTKLSFERETIAPATRQVAAGQQDVTAVAESKTPAANQGVTESLVAAASHRPATSESGKFTAVGSGAPQEVLTAVGAAAPKADNGKPVPTPGSTSTKAVGK